MERYSRIIVRNRSRREAGDHNVFMRVKRYLSKSGRSNVLSAAVPQPEVMEKQDRSF